MSTGCTRDVHPGGRYKVISFSLLEGFHDFG